MKGRLKRLGLTIDTIAYIVAVTMIEKERQDRLFTSYKEARSEKKTAGRELRSEIKKIEEVFGKPLEKITPDSRMEVFYEQHKAQPYLKAVIEMTLSEEKKIRELGETRPKQGYFDRFCDTFCTMFALSGKPPNSRLISDIANMFDLSDKDKPQTPTTIRKRIQRLP